MRKEKGAGLALLMRSGETIKGIERIWNELEAIIVTKNGLVVESKKCGVAKSFLEFYTEENKKGLSVKHKGKSYFVTALGFKPKTFSSVVRCSIQLSYAAIKGAKIIKYSFFPTSNCKIIIICPYFSHFKETLLMKINLWSVGKANENYVGQGIDLFTKRISHYFRVEWKLFAPAKNMEGSDLELFKKNEALPVLNALQKEDVLIILDERGKSWDSPGLADFMQQKANESTRNLVFLIGGAYGVHTSLLTRSQYTWSLSKLVFPHQLVRLMLAEQIYRACTIIRNEKYHHE